MFIRTEHFLASQSKSRAWPWQLGLAQNHRRAHRGLASERRQPLGAGDMDASGYHVGSMAKKLFEVCWEALHVEIGEGFILCKGLRPLKPRASLKRLNQAPPCQVSP